MMLAGGLGVFAVLLIVVGRSSSQDLPKKRASGQLDASAQDTFLTAEEQADPSSNDSDESDDDDRFELKTEYSRAPVLSVVMEATPSEEATSAPHHEASGAKATSYRSMPRAYGSQDEDRYIIAAVASCHPGKGLSTD